MTTKALSVKNISKHFGKKHVLDNVSLEVKQGEIFGLIGLNGVGKSTMIKIILRILKQDQGNIKVFGESTNLIKVKKKIAFLPEKFSPSPYLTGKEFIDLSISYYKQKYDKEAAEKFAEKISLDPEALNMRVSKYSKGMGQKIGLISTIMTDAPLLILDEPMSGLDPKARIALKESIIEYAKSGKTIFFSSHILSDIDEICDRVAILHDSKIQFCGTPKSFKIKYKEKSLERSFIKAIE